MPEEVAAAYHGSPEETVSVVVPTGDVVEIYSGGCAAEGKQALYGQSLGGIEGTRLALYGVANIHDAVLDVDQVAAAESAWSSCMADAGFDLPRPDDVTVPLGTALTPVLNDEQSVEKLKALEVGLASAHKHCLEATAARDIYQGHFTTLADELLQSTAEAARQWNQMRDLADDKARVILRQSR
jgi:hypothetical protein